MKSEPQVYAIDHLKKDHFEIWDGVRNYQARNYLMSMECGDWAFFYHSNTKPPGIAGLMRVHRAAVVDPSQFDSQNRYYDPRSAAEKPLWQTVEVEYLAHAAHYISLEELRKLFQEHELILLKRGSRLSITPVEKDVAQRLLKLGQFPTLFQDSFGD